MHDELNLKLIACIDGIILLKLYFFSVGIVHAQNFKVKLNTVDTKLNMICETIHCLRHSICITLLAARIMFSVIF